MRLVYCILSVIIGALVTAMAGFLFFSLPVGAQLPPLSLSSQPQALVSSPLLCNYTYTQETGASIVPGATDLGLVGDDITTTIALPFAYSLYDQAFTSAVVSTNGTLQFASDTPRSANTCLPNANFAYTIYAHWQDLATFCETCGVFTLVSGSAPNRIFNIEWRATYGFKDPTPINFEVRLYEGQTRFELIYGFVPEGGVSATVGVQQNSAGTTYTQFSCNTLNSLSDGLKIIFTLPPCLTPSPTPPVAGTLVGHVTWQGRAAQPNAAQMMPITLTLKSAATEVNYPIAVTDQSGFFTTSLGSLPAGTYNWRVKGPSYLARAGTVNLTGGIRQLEMGLQLAADTNGDNVVNSSDFTTLKNNFGQGGAPPVGPSKDEGRKTTNDEGPRTKDKEQQLASASVIRHSSFVGPQAPTDICSYAVSQSVGVLVQGTDDTGNHCDDCVTTIKLPFPYQLYDESFTMANVSSNGTMQLGSASPRSANTCLPAQDFNYTIFPHWGDLVTDCFECGIFTSVTGSAPNRIFNVEWRAAFFEGLPVNFELRLYEGQTRFDVVYGSVPSGGASATVGVQKSPAGPYTQYECNTVGTLTDGIVLTFVGAPCGTPTVTPIPTPCSRKATICHRTGSARNPYKKITVNCHALPSHLEHGDIYPVPESGCPSGVVFTPTPTPTELLRPSSDADCDLPRADEGRRTKDESHSTYSSFVLRPLSFVQSDHPARRESAPSGVGPPPRTGPASPSTPLDIPNFGPNYRANTDPQSPNLAQQEPGIGVNPKNPLNVVVAAKDERAGSNTKHIWIYTSTDGGVNWLNQQFPLRTPVAPYSSDPVVSFSDDGVCYVTVLPYFPMGANVRTNGTPAVGIQVARSFDGGLTFEPASEVTNNPYADKEWTWIDNNPGSPFYHRMYVAWADFTTQPISIRLNYSTDRGLTWTQSSFGPRALQFPMPVSLPNGHVILTYLSMLNDFVFARSTDGGVTFDPPQTIAPVIFPNCPPDNSGCGIWRLSPIPSNAVNPIDGTQVLMWSDGVFTESTVIFSRSTDDGVTWSTPQALAPPPVQGTYQVEPWVTSDENGDFHAIWYDDRENPNTSIFHVYYSQSTDDGATWSKPWRISTAASDLRIGIPSTYNRAAGDYINITAVRGNVYAAWTDTRSGTGEDIYVVRGTFGGTPTSTPTGTPPTVTNTRTRTSTPTRTFTPTPTATLCGGGQYIITQGTATIVPGVDDIGNHCGECITNIALPFPYRLYDLTFGAVNVSSDGNLQFNSNYESGENSCLPASGLSYAILPHWDDLRTDEVGNYGIYTSLSGSAPNRVFNIEWRATLSNRRGDINFEVRLYEGQTRFDVIYGAVPQYGGSATIGVQHSTGTNYTQFECNTGGVDNGTLLRFFLPPCGTATPTFTGTPPTLTRTPTRTPTVCVGDYTYTTATATIEPGSDDIDVHCDDCTNTIQLPFPVRFYDQLFNVADVSSNGNLQFTSSNPVPFNPCLSALDVDAAIMPHWDDLLTDVRSGCPTGGCGVFTSVSGSAPNRVFNIEWRAVLYSNPTRPVNFEVRLYENGVGLESSKFKVQSSKLSDRTLDVGPSTFDFVYGQVPGNGGSATIGVQNDATRFSQFSCDTPSLSQGMLIRWTLGGCTVSTPTITTTPCTICTATRTGTPTRTRTASPTITATPCGETIFEGALTLQDPTQSGRHFRDGNRATCDFPKSCPAVKDTAQRHYDSYTLTNSNASTQCITVDVNTLCIALNEIFVVAYLDSYSPSRICENYLADIGSSPFAHEFMSFEVPAGRSIVLVVSEVTTNQGCTGYNLVVRGLGLCGTHTPTPTGTPPTATNTPTRTATPCGYDFVTATATIVPGTQDIGNHCDDCINTVRFPFSFRLYGNEYNQARVSSNGNLQFVTGSSNRLNTCLPAPSLGVALLPLWSDLITDCAQCGVYTSVTGIAPNRVYNIEWRAGYFKEVGSANFEARLYEGTGVFDFVYGQLTFPGDNATVGVQAPGALSYSQFRCNGGGLTPNLRVRGIYQQCGTPEPTPILTQTVTQTPIVTQTPTPTLCEMDFSDVNPDDYFYESVHYLYCAGVISGYADGSFRPYNNTTRGQLSKIVVLAMGWEVVCPETGRFTDVPPGHAFFCYIETAYEHNIITGYGDNTFRPDNYITRGQLCKVVVLAMGWTDPCPETGHFSDVPPGSPFFCYIETAFAHSIITGYSDGTFRPNNNAARGQICKVVYEAITTR